MHMHDKNTLNVHDVLHANSNIASQIAQYI